MPSQVGRGSGGQHRENAVLPLSMRVGALCPGVQDRQDNIGGRERLSGIDKGVIHCDTCAVILLISLMFANSKQSGRQRSAKMGKDQQNRPPAKLSRERKLGEEEKKS